MSFEKVFSVGISGTIPIQLCAAIRGRSFTRYDVIDSLEGRNVTKKPLNAMLDDAIARWLQPLTSLDLDVQFVNAELECERTTRRSGPMAENVVCDTVKRINANLAAQGARLPADKVGTVQMATPSTRAGTTSVLPEGNN